MLAYFTEFMNEQVKSEIDLKDVGPWGRIEVVNEHGQVCFEEHFADMRTHPPDCEVTFEYSGFEDYLKMIECIDNDNMIKACSIASGLKNPQIEVKEKGGNSLSQRMADVEYPFLHYIKELKMHFNLLNPSAGTVSRIQKIIPHLNATIYLTCQDEEFFDEYHAKILKYNDANWPVVIMSVDDLPKGRYYSGFTARKYIDTLDVFGFELNPKYVMTSYDQPFNFRQCDGYDEISIDRSTKYKYTEQYYYKPSYYRYHGDMLKNFFRHKSGYFAKSMPWMYNFISKFPFDSFNTPKVSNDVITDYTCYAMDKGVFTSPYNHYEIEKKLQFDVYYKDGNLLYVYTWDKYKWVSSYEFTFDPPMDDLAEKDKKKLFNLWCWEPRIPFEGPMIARHVIPDREEYTCGQGAPLDMSEDDMWYIFRKYDICIPWTLFISRIKEHCVYEHTGEEFKYGFFDSSSPTDQDWVCCSSNKVHISFERDKKYYYRHQIVSSVPYNMVFTLRDNFIHVDWCYDGVLKIENDTSYVKFSVITDTEGCIKLQNGSYAIPFSPNIDALSDYYKMRHRYPLVKYYMNNEYQVSSDTTFDIPEYSYTEAPT